MRMYVSVLVLVWLITHTASAAAVGQHPSYAERLAKYNRLRQQRLHKRTAGITETKKTPRNLRSEEETQLVDNLFNLQSYNPLIRPVTNMTQTVTVDFGMAMVQLINVDERNQIMKSNVWLRMSWYDYQLKWDPKEFGGVDSLRICPKHVWNPDIVLFNTADGKYEVSYKPNVVISYTGQVLWVPPSIYKSACTINVKYFPFDEQTCKLTFGSWTFNADQVVLDWFSKDFVDLSDYVNSGSWDIMSCPGYIYRKVDNNQKQIYIEFELKLRRKTLFYTFNLIIPCVIISFLSACVFYLPADAGEKMTMCISVLLALVVFMFLVSKLTPPTSVTIPLIAKYLLFTFIMDISSIVITVFLLSWNFRTPRTHRMPKSVRIIFLNYLPRLLLMKRPNHDDRAQQQTTSKMSNQIRQLFALNHARLEHLHQYNQHNVNSTPHHNLVHHPRCHMFSRCHDTISTVSEAVDSPVEISPEQHKAIEAVRFIAAHLKNEDDYAEILEDWRYIAMVIDRLQLYLFLAVTVIGTILFFINAPHLFQYVDQDKIKVQYYAPS